ncbi:MAG: gfo/Idh/MocA family oxidoreductase [Nitrospirales bacterium]|nr:gfo/Idh/MocA family oxidoreductase [Nitrospirales bacterium]
MAPLTVGVIGVGHLGQHHARLYQALPHTTLVGVADLDRDRASEIGQRYRVPAYTNSALLLPHIQAVSVAVPTAEHFIVVKHCLEAGVHVLVEKPFATSAKESRVLIALAKERGVTLQVGHIERFNPVITAIAPHIQRPEYIEWQRMSLFQERGLDVSVVLDLMIHDLDLLLSFPLGPVCTVDGRGGTVFSSHLDIANARIEFESGCVAHFTASRVAPSRVRHFSMLQDNSYLTVDLDTRHAAIYPRQKDLGIPEPQRIQGNDQEPLKLELEAFIHAVQTQTRPRVSGEDGLAALELAEQIIEAIQARATHSHYHR